MSLEITVRVQTTKILWEMEPPLPEFDWSNLSGSLRQTRERMPLLHYNNSISLQEGSRPPQLLCQ